MHYSGHAMFNAEYPDQSGGSFAVDALTPSKLENVLLAAEPDLRQRVYLRRVVVGMAAPTARATAVGKGGRTQARVRGAQVTREWSPASRRSSSTTAAWRTTSGTAWEIPERPAKIFADKFYKALTLVTALPGAGASGATLGRAVQEARKAPDRQRRQLGKTRNGVGSLPALRRSHSHPARRGLPGHFPHVGGGIALGDRLAMANSQDLGVAEVGELSRRPQVLVVIQRQARPAGCKLRPGGDDVPSEQRTLFRPPERQAAGRVSGRLHDLQRPDVIARLQPAIDFTRVVPAQTKRQAQLKAVNLKRPAAAPG